MKKQPAGWTTNLTSLASDAEIRALLKEAERRGGWTGRKTGHMHIMLRHESGASALMSGSPGGGRAMANARAQIRRAEATGGKVR